MATSKSMIHIQYMKIAHVCEVSDVIQSEEDFHAPTMTFCISAKGLYLLIVGTFDLEYRVQLRYQQQTQVLLLSVDTRDCDTGAPSPAGRRGWGMRAAFIELER
ncbi:hypothetical protein DXZ20_16350 [Leptolyngbyaceae cyanobacterium CCMR0081]|uniref:Uncharacterized protein n=1 Tax=Adonisia turfae CCMR0081 TaxID=2292702 RepID=A0A6M0RLT9_9CYAN|nr:hypothetical protein [Adonisia turfae CCMR0081]